MSDLEDGTSKGKHLDNTYIEPSQQQTVVDMKGKYSVSLILQKQISLIFIEFEFCFSPSLIFLNIF